MSHGLHCPPVSPVLAGSLPCDFPEQYHSLVVIRGGLHSCRQCTYVTKEMTKMTVHLHKHTGEPFLCHLCPAAFPKKDGLKRHLQTHTGERPFSCVYCSASFAQKGHLNGHLRTHTGERPFSCAHCKSSFKLKATLKDHMHTHTGERPFFCMHCGYSFTQKGSLNRHFLLCSARKKP